MTVAMRARSRPVAAVPVEAVVGRPAGGFESFTGRYSPAPVAPCHLAAGAPAETAALHCHGVAPLSRPWRRSEPAMPRVAVGRAFADVARLDQFFADWEGVLR